MGLTNIFRIYEDTYLNPRMEAITEIVISQIAQTELLKTLSKKSGKIITNEEAVESTAAYLGSTPKALNLFFDHILGLRIKLKSFRN